MVFVNHDAVERVVNDSPNTIDIYSTVTVFECVRAQVTYVDQSNNLLQRLGLRPDVDLIAYVPASTVVQRGWKVVYRGQRYSVYKVEQAEGIASQRLVLKELGSSSGTNLDA